MPTASVWVLGQLLYLKATLTGKNCSMISDSEEPKFCVLGTTTIRLVLSSDPF